MAYHAAILADSVGPHGLRLTTFEVTFPRMVLADMTRHRALSYSFESTRAVPTEARIDQVTIDPYIPTFRRRAKGMGGGEELTADEQREARARWMKARDAALAATSSLLWTGKEHAGRLLEPFSWITGIVSGTEWENFFALRSPPPHLPPDPKYPAQFELQQIAYDMEGLYWESEPEALEFGEWHLPLLNPNETEIARSMDDALAGPKASAGRCASVSYLKHHNEGSPLEAQVRWDTKLAPFAHWSPGEHPAMCCGDLFENTGNFQGWKQLRKFYPHEAIRPRDLQG